MTISCESHQKLADESLEMNIVKNASVRVVYTLCTRCTQKLQTINKEQFTAWNASNEQCL